MNCQCTIQPLQQEYIPVIVAAFTQLGWHKPSSVYQEYLQEQENGERCIWVLFTNDDTFAGYVTLKWRSHYAYFKEQHIPEIMDLNVLPEFRKKGFGSLLLEVAESAAAQKHTHVGLGVGLSVDYGAAQRLYVKRGYVPDGKGITHNYAYVQYYSSVQLDDDLVLWLIKSLKR